MVDLPDCACADRSYIPAAGATCDLASPIFLWAGPLEWDSSSWRVAHDGVAAVDASAIGEVDRPLDDDPAEVVRLDLGRHLLAPPHLAGVEDRHRRPAGRGDRQRLEHRRAAIQVVGDRDGGGG